LDPNSMTRMRRHVPPSLSGTAGSVLQVMTMLNWGRWGRCRARQMMVSPPELLHDAHVQALALPGSCRAREPARLGAPSTRPPPQRLCVNSAVGSLQQ
jgi:hypothetical protein